MDVTFDVQWHLSNQTGHLRDLLTWLLSDRWLYCRGALQGVETIGGCDMLQHQTEEHK